MNINTIVVGVDFSEQSEAAAVEALDIAKHVGARVVLVHVGEVPGEGATSSNSVAAEWERAVRAQATQDHARLETLVTELSESGVEVAHRVVDGHPEDGVCEAAKELGAELVVTGSQGRSGLTRFLLGSVAERIVRQAETNVIVSRNNNPDSEGYRRVLVLTDFSRHAERTLETALALVRDGGQVELMHFYQLPMIATGPAKKLASKASASVVDALKTEVDDEGAKLVERYQPENATLSFVSRRDAVMHGIEQIGDADPPYDVVAVGSHGHRGFRRLILGSVAEKAMRHAKCSVLIVYGDESDHD